VWARLCGAATSRVLQVPPRVGRGHLVGGEGGQADCEVGGWGGGSGVVLGTWCVGGASMRARGRRVQSWQA
jgi:hypothetical protein